jgi:hypothetical protein
MFLCLTLSLCFYVYHSVLFMLKRLSNRVGVDFITDGLFMPSRSSCLFKEGNSQGKGSKSHIV